MNKSLFLVAIAALSLGSLNAGNAGTFGAGEGTTGYTPPTVKKGHGIQVGAGSGGAGVEAAKKRGKAVSGATGAVTQGTETQAQYDALHPSK